MASELESIRERRFLARVGRVAAAAWAASFSGCSEPIVHPTKPPRPVVNPGPRICPSTYPDPNPQRPGSERRLGDIRFRHPHAVSDVLFSDDGRYLISCTFDDLRVWTTNDGALLADHEVSCYGELTSDGVHVYGFVVEEGDDLVPRRLLADGWTIDPTWTTSARTDLIQAAGHSYSIDDGLYIDDDETPRVPAGALPEKPETFAVSGDGRSVALAGNQIVLISVGGSQPVITTLAPKEGPFEYKVAFSPTQATLLGVTYGKLLVWSTTGALQRTIAVDNFNSPERMVVSPKGDLIAISYPDEVQVWDPRQWTVVGSIPRPLLYNSTSSALAFSPDSEWLAVGDTEGYVRIHDATSGRECFPTPTTMAVRGLSADRGRVIWQAVNEAYLWRGSSSPELLAKSLNAFGGPHFVDPGMVGLPGSGEPLVHLADVDGQSPRTIGMSGDDFLVAGGNIVAVGGLGHATWMDLVSGESGSFTGAALPINGLSMSGNGRYLVVYDDEDDIVDASQRVELSYVVDTQTGELTRTIDRGYTMAVSPRGTVLHWDDDEGRLRLMGRGARRRLRLPRGATPVLAEFIDAETVAVVSDDGSLCTFRGKHPHCRHVGRVTELAIDRSTGHVVTSDGVSIHTWQ